MRPAHTRTERNRQLSPGRAEAESMATGVTVSLRVVPRLRHIVAAWPEWLAAAGLATCATELAGRQVIRQSIFQNLTGAVPPSPGVLIAAAALVLLANGAWSWLRGRLSVTRAVALVLAWSFVAGLAVQQRVGARLQSDGFYYFAFLRSIVNDHDVSLANDYALIGIGNDALLTPTSTGYAQTAWSIGPALMWMPFYVVGDVGARYLASHGAKVAVDGSPFPYREAICIAGLFYGLLGFWFCYRLAARYFPDLVAAIAMLAMAVGSFMLWYLVKEPTMSHATSMCVVAAFLYAWSATGGGRKPWLWGALGVLGGLMLAVRWQNLIFFAFPACDIALAIRSRDASERRGALAGGGLFAAGAILGFLPQMIAWNAIYGSPLAVSPLSPRMYWSSPDIVGMLWSSRNGLFATSPVTYLAAIGLVVWALRRSTTAWLSLGVFCMAVYVNASVADWWGGSAFSARRFDGSIVLLVLGLAAGIEALRVWTARHPLAPAVVLAAALGLWNLTAINAALDGHFGGSGPQSFSDLAVDQARTLHRWFGHPFSYPASLVYALREGVAPARYDWFAFPFLGDPERQYGRVDVGREGSVYLGDGWYSAEVLPDGTTARWTSGTGELLLPLAHPAPLTVQLRLRAFSYPGSSPQLILRVNGHGFGPIPVGGDWQRLDVQTDAPAWKAGVNHVQLVWPMAAAPAAVRAGGDRRELGGMVDWLRIEVPK